MRTGNFQQSMPSARSIARTRSRSSVRRETINAVLEVAHSTSQPLVALSYSTAVKIDAGNFPWRSGQTMPFSAGFDTKLRFD